MRYQWIAAYTDGTTLRQFNEDGTENKYGDIVRNKLAGFSLLTDGMEPADYPMLCIHLDPKTDRLIYRRRVEQWGNGEIDKCVVIIVGVQRKTARGITSQCINVLFEDGHIEQVSDWREGTPWFYAPVIHPHEGEEWSTIPSV